MNRDSVVEAWREFVGGVAFQAFSLQLDAEEAGRHLPAPIAWLRAPWGPLAYRFRRYPLERLFRPNKAERRDRLFRLTDFAFWWGGAELTEEDWAEADVLLAEFGGDFPPRDWKPVSAAEAVGMGMGMSREAVAEIVAKP